MEKKCCSVEGLEIGMATIYTVSNIDDVLEREKNEFSRNKAVKNQLQASYFHGGAGLTREKQIEVDEYNKKCGLLIKPFERIDFLGENDVIAFSDRENFYKGWKWLESNDLLRRTVCIVIESGVVDRKCGVRILRLIKNTFPVFLTYQDDLVDDDKFIKLWPTNNIRPFVRNNIIDYDERGLASIICTNRLSSEEPGELYSERKRIIEWFEIHDQYQFGIYGRRWDGYRNYKGICVEKSEAYDKYKFAFCLENSRSNGYITEKIFDCFINGIVPIYGGAKNVDKYIPKDCFIDYYSFESIDSLVSYLDSMEEETYNEYIDNIECFLQSEQAMRMDVVTRADYYLRAYQQIQKVRNHFNVGWREKLKMYIYVECFEKRKKLKWKMIDKKNKLINTIKNLLTKYCGLELRK